MDTKTFLAKLESASNYLQQVFAERKLDQQWLEALSTKSASRLNFSQANSQLKLLQWSFGASEVRAFSNINQRSLLLLVEPFCDLARFHSSARLEILSADFSLLESSKVFIKLEKSEEERKLVPLEKFALALYFLANGWLLFLLFQMHLQAPKNLPLQALLLDQATLQALLDNLLGFLKANESHLFYFEGLTDQEEIEKWNRLAPLLLANKRATQGKDQQSSNNPAVARPFDFLQTDAESVIGNSPFVLTTLRENEERFEPLFLVARSKLKPLVLWFARNQDVLRIVDTKLPSDYLNALFFLMSNQLVRANFLEEARDEVALFFLDLFSVLLPILLREIEADFWRKNDLFLLCKLHHELKEFFQPKRLALFLLDCCIFSALRVEICNFVLMKKKYPWKSAFEKLKALLMSCVTNVSFEPKLLLFHEDLFCLLRDC